ncbi:hypothetical protein J3R83DRAFT_7138 [Lanmaoa asiatica]|nr:hypothetical protein J3R83DRAFT_7138 [Lanmaoa asiatica]
MPLTSQYAQLQYPCSHPGCNRWFKNQSGLTQHQHAKHPRVSVSPPPSPSPRPDSPPISLNVRPTRSPTPHVGEDADFLNVEAEYLGPHNAVFRNYHPFMTGRPCDSTGDFLLPGAQPLPDLPHEDDWTPFHDRLEFEVADFLYTRNQMPAQQIDMLLDIWGESLHKAGSHPLYTNHKDLYHTIDTIQEGDVKWECFSLKYAHMLGDEDHAPWMDTAYDVWFRCPRKTIHNILANPELEAKMDYEPYREYDTNTDERRFQDFMGGDWAWDQADIISRDHPDCEGAMFVPIVLGSDKMTVSMATGQHDYYPLYLSIGNVHNSARRSHRNGVALIGFLATPKTTREEAKTARFRKFRRQLFHVSLSRILQVLKPHMTQWEVVRCGDRHYRRAVYGLGPYIADYEEQALLACIVRNWCARCLGHRTNLDEGGLLRSRDHTDILVEELDVDDLWNEFGIVADIVVSVFSCCCNIGTHYSQPFTNDFPRADICQLLSPDILHQLIKGVFKDHLVDWVEKYLIVTYGKKRADAILDDIDRRIASVASFAGLRRFPQGRHFKQWTGDDSKALMKVYLAAIEGHVPRDILRTFRTFLEFCYLVRKDIITTSDLAQLQDNLSQFHRYRAVFMNTGATKSFSLPRQHSLIHYFKLIKQFGAPNGLCSSITESKHIKAVKMPYRRSSRHKALGQMLVINQRLDKLRAAWIKFHSRGMLISRAGSTVGDSDILQQQHAQLAEEDFLPPEENASQREDLGDFEPVDSPRVDAFVHLAKTAQRNRAKSIPHLAEELGIPHLPQLVRAFLHTKIHSDDDRPCDTCPFYIGRISIFNSASSTFYAPSDLCGTGGMRREYIRSCPNWRNGGPRHDCVFVVTNAELAGFRGMDVARILCFFSFTFQGILYPCAVVRWFDHVGDAPNDNTGMWIVKPSVTAARQPKIAVIHADAIFRAAHLIPVYAAATPIPPQGIPPNRSYDHFRLFYVNKFADHHSFATAF